MLISSQDLGDLVLIVRGKGKRNFKKRKNNEKRLAWERNCPDCAFFFLLHLFEKERSAKAT